MHLTVTRKEFTEESTIGELSVNGQFFCYTLEDKVRDIGKDGEGKVPGKTAIPYGQYEVICNKSDRFKKYMPLVLGVPFFSGIRIHSGNTDVDTEGCILVGFVRGKNFIGESKKAFNALMKLLAAEKKEKIFISVVKDLGVV